MPGFQSKKQTIFGKHQRPVDEVMIVIYCYDCFDCYDPPLVILQLNGSHGHIDKCTAAWLLKLVHGCPWPVLG